MAFVKDSHLVVWAFIDLASSGNDVGSSSVKDGCLVVWALRASHLNDVRTNNGVRKEVTNALRSAVRARTKGRS